MSDTQDLSIEDIEEMNIPEKLKRAKELLETLSPMLKEQEKLSYSEADSILALTERVLFIVKECNDVYYSSNHRSAEDELRLEELKKAFIFRVMDIQSRILSHLEK